MTQSHGFTDRTGLAAPIADPHRKVQVICWMLDDTRVKAVTVTSLDRTRSASLPRSQISIVRGKRDQVEITMPRWLAVREELIADTDERQGRLL